MMEVMIYGSGIVRETKKESAGVLVACWFFGFRFKGFLQQIEFFGTVDGRPAVVHPQLAVNVLGMGPYGV